jgi:triphosphatase
VLDNAFTGGNEKALFSIRVHNASTGGYAHMDAAVRFPTTPKAVKAASLKLNKRTSVEQAFQAIARSCIDQVQANAQGVARFQHAESVHQMRVGLRRLRAAFTLFADVLEAPADLKTEVKWLMDQLGAARDWDVLFGATLAQVEAAMPGHPALAELRQAGQQQLHTLHQQATQAVASPRFEKLLSKLALWLDQRGWREALAPEDKLRLKMRVAHFAGAVLDKEQQRLTKRGARLKGATAEQRHRVRIAAKRARYATEFFASLYPRKRVRPYVAAVQALQSELGLLNDASVAQQLLADLCAANPALREGAALACGYLAARTELCEPNARKLVKTLAAIAPPH